MPDNSERRLLDRNIDVLRQTGHEEIVNQIMVLPTPAPGRTLRKEDGTPLYQPNSETFVDAQLAEYIKNPARHFLSISGAPETSTQISHKAMRQMMEQLQGKFLNATPDLNSGHFISFGLGLGHHLLRIVEVYDFRELIVIEPNPDYLYQSLVDFDWSELQKRLEDTGRAFSIICSTEPANAAGALLPKLRGKNFPLLDGMFVYLHYDSVVMQQIVNEVRCLMPVVEGTDGFFEDEQRMLEQAVTNCTTHDHHVLFDKTGRSLKEIPVFVAGAGPSLDDCIEDIRRNRENVILVSCSTSLRPLLSAGLVPDFHAEVENMPDNVTIIQDAAGVHDISNIVLLATNTVLPGVLEPFKQRILYWRESIVPTRLFSDLEHYMNMAAPSVANLAVRACISMGFYEFYLFGVDMGSRDPSQHHSKASIYYDRTDEYWNSGARMDPFVIPQKGNMRETVYTNSSFLLCKMYMDRLFRTFTNHFFFNCSDGVQFERSTSILPRTLTTLRPEKSRREFVDLCLTEINFCEAGEQIDPVKLRGYRDTLSNWFSEALQHVRSETDLSVHELVSAFGPLLSTSFTDSRFNVASAVRGLCSGTITSIFQFAYFLERRLPPEDRSLFMDNFRNVLESSLLEMQTDGLRLADRSLALFPEGETDA